MCDVMAEDLIISRVWTKCDWCDHLSEQKKDHWDHVYEKHLGKGPFKCFRCSYSTPKRYCMIAHISSATPCEPEQVVDHNYAKRLDVIKSCPHCSFTSVTSTSAKEAKKRTTAFQSHLRMCAASKQSLTPKNNFICPLCEFEFVDSESVDAHLESSHA